MPRKDPKAKNAYQREFYRTGNQAAKQKARVRLRSLTKYAGTCKNCGGPTVGMSKGKAPEWCGKPECASAQRKALVAANPEYYRQLGLKGQKIQRKLYHPTLGEFIEREVVK